MLQPACDSHPEIKALKPRKEVQSSQVLRGRQDRELQLPEETEELPALASELLREPAEPDADKRTEEQGNWRQVPGHGHFEQLIDQAVLQFEIDAAVPAEALKLEVSQADFSASRISADPDMPAVQRSWLSSGLAERQEFSLRWISGANSPQLVRNNLPSAEEHELQLRPARRREHCGCEGLRSLTANRAEQREIIIIIIAN